jgi:hypothetical protein
MSRIKPQEAGVLPIKAELRIANEYTARSPFSREHLEVFVESGSFAFARAQVLPAQGGMPSLETVLTVVAETRKK